MRTLSSVLDEILAGAEADPLSEDAEAAAIVEAAEGDTDALVALMRAHHRGIRAAMARFRSVGLDLDEARAALSFGFFQAVKHHDPAQSPRLAGILRPYLDSALSDLAGESAAIPVPGRTRKRYFAALREAKGDRDLAADLAPSYNLDATTFRAIELALRDTENLDHAAAAEQGGVGARVGSRSGVAPLWGDGTRDYGIAEDVELARYALGGLEGTHAEIVRLSYGLGGEDPLPDAEIAHRLGMTRPTVQRRRKEGLEVMRARIAGLEA